MSAYLLLLLDEIWGWVFAPPLHWAFSLSIEWKLELAALVVLVVFHRAIIEHYVVGGEAVRDWWTEKNRLQEWYYYGRMNEREFRACMEAIRREIRRQESLALRLRLSSYDGFRGDILRKAAVRRGARAQSLRDELVRLDELWQEIEKERRGSGDDSGMRQKLRRLMRMLGSHLNASEALAELNRIGNRFDWESLAPPALAEADRKRLAQLLRQMAGTSSVAEAQNALRRAQQILEDNLCEWRWEAA